MGSGRKVTGIGAKGGWERAQQKSLRIVAMHRLTGIYVQLKGRSKPHSFFSSTAGFVRAALHTCQKTAAKAIDTASTTATRNIHQ